MLFFLNHRFFSLFFWLFIFSQLNFGQQQKPLTLKDYAQWKSINNTAISPDGVWMTYAYKPNEGDAKLYIRRLNGDTLRTVINGKEVSFSSDSNWLAFLVDPTKKMADKLKASKKPILSDLQIVHLDTNVVSVVKTVKSFKFSKTSKFIAVHKQPNNTKADYKGSDLLLKDLESNKTLNIGNVSAYAFNKEGTLLSYLIDAEDDYGNGLYVVDLNDFRIRPLHTGSYTYSQMTWNKETNQIAVLFGGKKKGNVERDNTVYWTSNLISGMTTPIVHNQYSVTEDADFPKNMVISEYSKLTWNKEGTQLLHGVKAQQTELKKADEQKANVDVWHWKDERVQSRQIVQAGRDRKSNFKAVLNLENKTFIQLENEDMPSVNYSENSLWAIGKLDTLYRKNVGIPGGYTDLYSINTQTGKKELIAEKVYRYMGMSPNGEWVLFSKEGDVIGYNFEQGKLSNLTAKTGISFINEDYDKPVEKPTYGVAGWSKDGNTLILNHEYDLWTIALNSDEVVNLTQGIGNDENIRFRLIQLDPEAKTFDLMEPLLLSAYGDFTKKSGYYKVKFGEKPEMLCYENKMITGITKARKADKLIYKAQSFEDFPDYWLTDLSFKKPKKITNANPQQSKYKWGKRILVDYTDERGHALQATLALPADYDSNKKYPMIVYFYEKMSHMHHLYSMPKYDDRPHASTYASNGYLVLMPDIVFDVGMPGSSALDDVTSAAKEVVKLGYADPDKIGLQGHSWGGYESSFIVTQTDMFAAVVTGAPLTNLVSMYNIAYKSSGILNSPIIEWSQGRMGVSPWQNMELYLSQSPLHHAHKIKTPFLILHGTSDGAVDWNQGLEFYSAARRLGKEVILLSYPNEPHHLSKKDNQKDFQIRMKQYFDYYLKGDIAPIWMKEGVNHLDKKRLGPEILEKID
ncbi:hypothetical protein APS56_02820 [Pseudalgibacter alginicilyticus]|uniref:Peptidase S9 prolyl oligopeptidase catalytic domain-containing protein n=1 Tax=Pseudalgibacter alginicilyticus TaxID=1736674 RepID=A0A0P0CMY5_9FLAO|nr:prolyl oligopeptidase family serine peptidase [Pseudalgibacter alginicilyticus]ALJ04146.1 hypothetical protein APS56_02820 [Pseudalgibacter alginicilyticus]